MSKTSSFSNHVLKWRDFILNLIFPIECLNCGKENTWLCQSCFKKINFRFEQHCLECQKKTKLGEFCPKCKHSYMIDGILIAGNYNNEILAKLIKRLKYGHSREVAKILANFLFIFFNTTKNELEFNWQEAIIIPAPLHKKRQRSRGFNQSKIIAEPIATKLNLKLSEKLVKIKHTKVQAKLNRKERQQNLLNCFSWKGDDLNGKNIILIDDVVTTGSTLNECAKVLKKAGAGKVWGLCLANG